MKRSLKNKTHIFLLLIAIPLFNSCKKSKEKKDIAANWDTHFIIGQDFEQNELSQEFKNYWYAGKAEISSYKLEQVRYGEIRQGQSILIYVTEDFLPNIQVKADRKNADNIPVLKLNATKNFNTGIYPYSIMQSTFYPVSNNEHAIKVSSSMQEWCGHVYMQLNNKEQFEIKSHSYFQGEADQNLKLKKAILENELWSQLRINPKSLPTGNIEVMPSFEFIRMSHIPIKTFKANAILTNNSYAITYPELNRKLVISFNSKFPYDILGWEESVENLTTKSTKLKTIKSAYWQKNTTKDEILRDTLLLK